MNLSTYNHILEKIKNTDTKLVVVSKTRTNEEIMPFYNVGQRHFGENKVQEIIQKQDSLPKDIHWHLIGHLQTNKVKQIVSFVHLIHSVDSEKLFFEIQKQAEKIERTVSVLLQVYIAEEETKFGFSEDELFSFLSSISAEKSKNIEIVGLMGMATNTDDSAKIEKEFSYLQELFSRTKTQFFSEQKSFREISMGMSNDYDIALQNGSTMLRIGSILF